MASITAQTAAPPATGPPDANTAASEACRSASAASAEPSSRPDEPSHSVSACTSTWMALSKAATPAAPQRLNIRSSSGTAGASVSPGAPRTIHQPQASASKPAASDGSHKTGSQAGCTAAATSSTCSWVDTQDSRPPPAINRAGERPSRAASPSVAMVAVLDTKPEASAENATAWRACSRRRHRCASDCTASSKASSCTMT